MKRANAHPMTLAVEQSLERYFAALEGAKPAGIYDMVIMTVEKPMLQRVMLEAGVVEGSRAQRASWCCRGLTTYCSRQALLRGGRVGCGSVATRWRTSPGRG